MTLADIVKDYGVIITALAGLLGIFLTFIFTRSHYIRSRKWELEDRGFERRAKFRDKTLEKVDAYIDFLHDYSGKLYQYLTGIMVTGDLEYFKSLEDELYVMRRLVSKEATNLSLLEDEDLDNLNKELTELLEAEYYEKLKIKGVMLDQKMANRGPIFSKFFEVNNKVADLIGKMRKRLYIVAKNLP